MYRAIVPLIGSPQAEEVLSIARGLAATEHGVIDLVHVMTGQASQHASWSASRDAADAYLAAIAGSFPDRDCVRIHVLSGDPVDQILELSTKVESNVLVIAPRWSEHDQGFAPDSNSRAFIETLRIPTIMVPVSTQLPANRVKTILVPISDGRSRQALEAIEWLSPLDSFFRLVSIISPNGGQSGTSGSTGDLWRGHREPAIEHYQAELLRLSRHLSRRGIRNSWEVRYGRANDEILRAADTTETDLIVFAPPHTDEATLARAGANALTVAGRSRVPVLVFPADAGTELSASSPRDDPAEAARPNSVESPK